MVPIRIDDKGYVLPTSWNDVSVKMFHKLGKWFDNPARDMIGLYAILIDIDYDVMYRVRQMDVDSVLDPHIKWIHDRVDINSMPVPKSVTIKNNTIEVPKNLELEGYGQKMAIDADRSRISQLELSENDASYEMIVSVASIYFYKGITGGKEFDYGDVKAIRKWIEQAKFMDIYPVALFFYKNLYGYKNYKPRFWRINQALMKFKRKWRDWIGINSKRLTRYQAGIS